MAETSDENTSFSSGSSELIQEFENSDDEPLDEGCNFEALDHSKPPYLYEPDASDDDEDGARPDNRPDRMFRLELDRLGDWCTCTHCQVLATEQECICCSEIDMVTGKNLELEGHHSKKYSCITDTEGFKAVFLDVWVLQTAWFSFRNQYGKKAFEGPKADKYRHVAYRQFVRWCWGFCGPKIRVILPSCVVSCIRAHFPNNDDEEMSTYKGFRLPKLDE